MGNWKLNGTKSTVTDLIKAFREPADKNANVDVAICAPAIFIGMVESLATGSSLKWGSEDCDIHTKGAYTGENSPEMLKEFGCTYAIVGHSERRGYHNESNEIVAGKFKAAQDNGLTPVLCIGESEAEYDAGRLLMFARQKSRLLSIYAVSKLSRMQSLLTSQFGQSVLVRLQLLKSHRTFTTVSVSS